MITFARPRCYGDRVQHVYLDHNAASPIRTEVRAAIRDALGHRYGNPSSIHRPGHRAKLLLEAARLSVASLIHARPEEILFTSGGTEANNQALFGAARMKGRGHLIVSRIEHSSVLEAAGDLEQQGFRVSRIEPDRDGGVDPGAILSRIAPETFFIALMHSSNELGTLQPVERLAEAIRGRGILLHTDAVQSAGKIPLDVRTLGIDLLSLSAHKIGGPPGVGCLWIREGIVLSPLLRGGGQETNRRAGTEPLPLIAGFGAAADVASRETVESGARITRMRDRLELELARRFDGLTFHGRGRDRLPNTVSVAIDGSSGEELVMALDLEGIAVSTGSACAAGTVRPSHVLEAIGCGRDEARGTIRISLGRDNSDADLDRFLDALSGILTRTRRRADGRRASQAITGAHTLEGA